MSAHSCNPIPKFSIESAQSSVSPKTAWQCKMGKWVGLFAISVCFYTKTEITKLMVCFVVLVEIKGRVSE